MKPLAKPAALVILFVLTVFTARVGSLIAADAPKENATKKEMERLQGTWQLVAGAVFGQGYDGTARIWRAPR